MQQTPGRTLWIDYLRSFLTVLVIAHHSSLAYTTFASFDKVAYIRSTHPVVDSRRWIGLDIFENFNDVFFMSLMFLIAGLFVVKSIKRKGTRAFVRDRFYRLFVPFLIGGTILNLIAHYPAYLLAHGNPSLSAYVTDFFLVEQWPVGPPWFIWVLFAFNAAFALIYSFARTKNTTPANTSALASLPETIETPANVNSSGAHAYTPFTVIISWFFFTFVLYTPFAFLLGPGKWIGFGPFDFQVSRIAWYFGYFLLGAWLGNTGFNEGIFVTSSSLVGRWPRWLFLCACAYTLLTVAPPFLTDLVKQSTLPEFTAYLIYFSIYVLSCTFSCVAFLTTFRALATKPNPMWGSLSEHAYLVYLLHYPFVIWTQYLLLDAPLPAFVKFFITLLVSVTGSWSLAIQLRNVKIIAKYL